MAIISLRGLGDDNGGACCSACARARPALAGIGDLFSTASLNDAIRALGPVGACIDRSEVNRILGAYEAQLSKAMADQPWSTQNNWQTSINRSQALRASLPPKVCRPSSEFNSLVYMVSELWERGSTAQLQLQIQQAAYTEAAQVAAQKAGEIVEDAAAAAEGIGATLTGALKYWPWLAGGIGVLVAGAALRRVAGR